MPDGGITMKKTCAFLIVAISGWTGSLDAQYTTSSIGNYNYTTGRIGSSRISGSSTRIGSTVYTSVRPRTYGW
ncbi:MAG: hypothetical protein CME26_16045 [Gemmatimonadetes bacterium]|nr:hypothetical protein [Gemmatimonadota bacterium]